jgi:hypothetical protein
MSDLKVRPAVWLSEEGGGFAEEEIELIVMDPVAGVGHGDHAAIADGLPARIVLGNWKKGFESPEEQRRASDLAEKLDGVAHVMSVGRDRSDVVVEFPEQRAVGIPIGAVEGEMTGDLVGEPRVRFFHARDCGIEAPVALGAALFEVADIFDPAAHAIGRGTVYAVIGRKAQTFDGDGFVNASGIHAGVMKHDDAAERVADQADGKIADHVQHRGEIEDVLGDGVDGAGSPGAVAVAAQVQRVDVIVLAQRAGHPIPIARVIEGAVNEEECGLSIGAVIPELKLEAVGVEEVGDGFHDDVVGAS